MTRTCFDGSADRLATLTDDGRIRVWDSRTAALRTQLVEPGHLSTQLTCVAWGGSTSDATRTPGKKSKAHSSTTTLAVGTEKGAVILWNVEVGEVTHRVTAHSARVNDVVFDSAGQTLYTCSDDRHIAQVDVASGKVLSKWKADKQGIKRLALSPDNKTLLAASSVIKAWNTSAENRDSPIRKYAGHQTPVTQLRFLPNGRFFVSSCNDRFTSLWSCLPDDKDKNAKHVFTSSIVPEFLDVNYGQQGAKKSKGGHRCSVLATSNAGVVELWKIPEDGMLDSLSVQSAEGSVKLSSGAFLAFRLLPSGELLVARGSFVKPAFERVVVMDASSGNVLKEQVLERAEGGALLGSSVEGKKGAAGVSADNVNVVGAAGMKLAKPRTAEGSDGPQGDYISLADKVAQLKLPVLSEDPASGEKKEAPKSDSLLALLMQALQSDDNGLLEYCLGVRDPVTIQNSVRRLPTTLVLPFLLKVVGKFQTKPSRGIILSVWIRALLITHSSYLMTVPDLVNQLSGLYQVVDNRLVVFKKLLRLNGRLDLVTSQIGQRNESSGVADLEGRVYVEGGEDMDSGDESAAESDEDDDDADNDDDDVSDDGMSDDASEDDNMSDDDE